MPFKQAMPYPLVASKSTVAPFAKAAAEVWSVELLLTTITSLTRCFGISATTFPTAFSSLNAGIITTIFKSYIFNLIPSFPKVIGSESYRLSPESSPFSNFKTPLGQTAEQTPQPTQEERTMF